MKGGNSYPLDLGWSIQSPRGSVQSLSCVWLFATPWTSAHQASLSITNSRSLPKPMSIKSVMPSNHLILCRPLLLLPSICLSVKVFSNESALHIMWPEYWSFSFHISSHWNSAKCGCPEDKISSYFFPHRISGWYHVIQTVGGITIFVQSGLSRSARLEA